MPDDQQTTSAQPPAASPAAELPAAPAAAKAPRTPRRPPAISLFGLSQRATIILLGSVAVIAAAAMVAAIIHFAEKMTEPIAEGPPKLGPEFDFQACNIVLRPPLQWAIDDPHDGFNFYFVGPKEPGYRPLIIASLEIKAGGMESYLREHKGRIEAQERKERKGESNVTWLSENEDSIDGCPHTVRLEYEWDDASAGGPPVKVRTLQYIMEDKPRFYRVTCSVAADLYETYLPKFEASARSFRRTPLPKPIAQPLRP